MKASVTVATVEELKATFSALSAEEKAKMVSALSPTPAKVPSERMAQLVEHRNFGIAMQHSSTHSLIKLQKRLWSRICPSLTRITTYGTCVSKGFNMFGMFKQQYYMADELVDDFVGGGHNVTHTVFVTTHAFFTRCRAAVDGSA